MSPSDNEDHERRYQDQKEMRQILNDTDRKASEMSPNYIGEPGDYPRERRKKHNNPNSRTLYISEDAENTTRTIQTNNNNERILDDERNQRFYTERARVQQRSPYRDKRKRGLDKAGHEHLRDITHRIALLRVKLVYTMKL